MGTITERMILQPIFGALSDKIGRKTSTMPFGGLATLATIPILTALSTIKEPTAAFFLITAALAIVSFYTSISGLVKAELFPAEVRALSVGLFPFAGPEFIDWAMAACALCERLAP